jgi:hypothetical protein
MGAVADPGAARRDPLALHHRSGMSNHRYEITLATGLHLQDGEPVLGVMVVTRSTVPASASSGAAVLEVGCGIVIVQSGSVGIMR